MSDTRTVVVHKTFSFSSLLAVLFIGLKLTHNIDWSWVWVLSPLWLGWGLVFSILALFFLFLGIGLLLAKILP